MKFLTGLFFTVLTLNTLAFNFNNIPNLPNNLFHNETIKNDINTDINKINDLYQKLHLEEYISKDAFRVAVDGLNDIKGRLNNIITIVDFTRSSNTKRLCIIDLDKEEILVSTYVAHGRGTGGEVATSFSNVDGSYKSSPGFFITGNPYDGKNGNSLALYGLELGVNDKTRSRNIVVHGANYAEESFINKYGRLGRSWGCFAVPRNINDTIISLTKGGTVLYAHIKDTNRYALK